MILGYIWLQKKVQIAKEKVEISNSRIKKFENFHHKVVGYLFYWLFKVVVVKELFKKV